MQLMIELLKQGYESLTQINCMVNADLNKPTDDNAKNMYNL